MIDNIKDPEGKHYFKEWLENHQFSDVILTSNQYSNYDIVAQKDGETYIYELKNRPCYSTAYNDSIIELTKYDSLRSYAGHKYVVNFFKDCFYIVELEEEHELQTYMCQKTNNWDRTRVKKTLVSYKHKEINKYEYE